MNFSALSHDTPAQAGAVLLPMRQLWVRSMTGRGGRRTRMVLWGLIAVAAATLPAWAPPLLSHLSFFRLRSIQVDGIRYMSVAEVIAIMQVDTTMSIWIPLTPLEERLLEHPQLQSVNVTRSPPSTIRVRLSERLPVALVSTKEGLAVVEESGQAMAIDPTRANVDLPILQEADSTLLSLLAGVRELQPDLFERISQVRRLDGDEILVQLLTLPVYAMSDITAQRLADILPVELDLARRRVRVAALDLRFNGQIVARLR